MLSRCSPFRFSHARPSQATPLTRQRGFPNKLSSQTLIARPHEVPGIRKNGACCVCGNTMSQDCHEHTHTNRVYWCSVGKPCMKQYISHVSCPLRFAAKTAMCHWSLLRTCSRSSKSSCVLEGMVSLLRCQKISQIRFTGLS